MRYAAHRLLTRPALKTAALWRVVAGLALALGVTFGLVQGCLVVLRAALGGDAWLSLASDIERGATPAGALVTLALTGALGVGAIVAARLLHDRSALSLLGPPRRAARQALRVLVAVFVVQAAIAVLPPWDTYATLEPGRAFGPWLALLPLAALVLILQTGAEEVLFRGYLQSQLAARLRHPAVWLTVPSAIFAMAHWAPQTYGDNAPLVVGWAFAFGVLAGDLTARAGSLGPAIALHFANNLVAVTLSAPRGALDGLALYRLPFARDDPALAGLMPLQLGALSWLAARVALRV